jgi:aspartyl-tRNA(Asn)/glutamyl-tRNA(Gln) amidotransferase subunit B
MPGMLPVINEFCVEQAVRTGLGLKAKINLRSVFDRKNYFYPDLPQGYQISQFKHPIVGEGEVLVDMAPGIARKVRIERIHIEQDAGKSIHDMDPELSFVDLNRRSSRARMSGGRTKRRNTCASCARSCVIWAPATATCRKGACAPM